MSIPSNLYAEKIFSEHPTALWALDDTCDYVSLISEEDRDLSTWSFSNGTFSTIDNSYNQPFLNSHISKISLVDSPNRINYVECLSDNILNFKDLDSELSTFSISAYLYSISEYIAELFIGYQYVDPSNGETIQVLKKYESQIYGSWTLISDTFQNIDKDADFKIVLKFGFYKSSGIEDFSMLVNGITVGQWSEEFQSQSLGITKESLPSNIYGINNLYGIKSDSYSIGNKNGWYIIDNNSLRAKNTGVPIVYGSSNLTSIYPNGDNPSLLIPGLGFLNEVGQYKDYTFEFWMRLNSNLTESKRVIGPIGSEDGIYINGPFIGLKIGDSFKSHYVGEWYRPMLIHIRFSKDSASLLINGEEVVSLSFIASDLSFPPSLYNSKDYDWIGFWSYDDIDSFEIDCVAIYSYQVPAILAKRRFAYGQAVEFPENINSAYSGSSVYIDFPFADYSNSYSYPDLGTWNQGIKDNLVVSGKALSSPEYELPSLFLSNANKSASQLYSDCNANQIDTDYWFSLNPENSEVNPGYFLFESLQPTVEPTKAFYGIFKNTQDVIEEEPQTLVRIDQDGSENYFEIYMQKTNEDDSGYCTIKYDLVYGNSRETLTSLIGVPTNKKILVGLDIPTFSFSFGGNIANFFSNKKLLKVYLGGNKDFSNTYKGKIYNFSFCTARNFRDIESLFNSESGMPLLYEDVFALYQAADLALGYDAGNSKFIDAYSTWDYYIDSGDKPNWPADFPTIGSHTASYTLFARKHLGIYTLDISSQGYWEDHLPLTYLAQYVTDSKNNKYYDLDFIQFNLNYPSPSKFVQELDTGIWNYQDLQTQYSIPLSRSYQSLDNHLYTGYDNYLDLKNNSIKSFNYDTNNSLVKSYVTFQYTATGANSPEGYFIKTDKAPKYGVVSPGTEWITTRYEVVDNMIIYPPKSENINDLSIVYSLKFKTNGQKDGKVKLRSLQLASQSFNSSSPNKIGTRFGNAIYPYKKSGVYYNYKAKNAFSIYKGSTPYLYLTRTSGIQLRDGYDPVVDRGIAIPINESKSDNYKVVAMQLAVRYDQDFFPYAPTKIFEIEAKNKTLKIYLEANHPDGKRARIYAVNAGTGLEDNGVVFYINGHVVRDPNITIKEWSFLGIGFSELLNFSSQTGFIKSTGPLTVNTISHYKSTHLQEVQQISNRPWFKVAEGDSDPIDWEYWRSPYIFWRGVLVFSNSNYYGVDPSDVYKSYTGTDKIIVDSESTLLLNDYKYSFYGDVVWQPQVLDAV